MSYCRRFQKHPRAKKRNIYELQNCLNSQSFRASPATELPCARQPCKSCLATVTVWAL